ncbi:MAG: L-histidine N(alpha)-methyltransferase [Candidatus Aminicenantaceae bacterium]
MILNKKAPSIKTPINVINFLPQIGNEILRKEIIAGLTSTQKSISSKFFYDSVGSKLFEEITQLEEYYLTRTEKTILKELAHKIGDELKDFDIIELGSGDCSKISILFDAMPLKCIESVRYIPVDVSQSAIKESAAILFNNFSGLEIQGVVADFTKQLNLLPRGEKRLFCFFGSTIGNLKKEQSIQFIDNLSGLMRSSDVLLIGFDMVKNKDILEKAYNDSKNVTAEFNRNILNVVNRFIDTNFNPQDFEHVAFYNQEHSRIEMHLRALKNLEISSPYIDHKIILKQGETIHTENSYKFSDEAINEFALSSGLEIKNRFTDKNKWFSVIQFSKIKKDS